MKAKDPSICNKSRKTFYQQSYTRLFFFLNLKQHKGNKKSLELNRCHLVYSFLHNFFILLFAHFASFKVRHDSGFRDFNDFLLKVLRLLNKTVKANPVTNRKFFTDEYVPNLLFFL